MRKQAIVILLLMVPNLGWSTRLPPILASIQPGTITFIGESHQHAESALLVKQWVETLIRQNRCATLGLEIDSTQQPIMDRLLDGNASAADLTIPFSIDHPALRQMIDDLAMLKSPTSCFEMIALDAGVATDVDRDEFMAQRLSALSKEKPIVVLIGGLHTLKKINWTTPTGKPSVAELLSLTRLPCPVIPAALATRNLPGKQRQGQSVCQCQRTRGFNRLERIAYFFN